MDDAIRKQLENGSMSWYFAVWTKKITVIEFYDYYMAQYEEAKSEVDLNKAVSLESESRKIPGISEHRYSEWQEIESCLQLQEVILEQLIAEKLKSFEQTSNASVNYTEKMKWIQGDDTIVDQKQLIILITNLRNKYAGLSKGLDSKGKQIYNIVEIRKAGLDRMDVVLEEGKSERILNQ